MNGEHGDANANVNDDGMGVPTASSDMGPSHLIIFYVFDDFVNVFIIFLMFLTCFMLLMVFKVHFC